MTVRSYLFIALLLFFVTLLGARVAVAGHDLGDAIGDFLHRAWMAPILTAVLFVPFGLIAWICGLANRRAKTRGPAAIFAAGVMLLALSYVDGFRSSQEAMMAGRWTAAALSIGLLPFMVGLPVVIVVATGSALFVRFDRRPPIG